jgi:hypothetical protein
MYSGKSCCCDCGDKFCKGTEYFYDDTSIGCPICAVGISSMAGGTFAWPGAEPKHKMPNSDPWDGDNLFIGEPCWSSDVCEDYPECLDDMFPPHYYQLLSPMGPLPWTPQAFEDWIDNYHGPLVPKGDCTMHCTEENIGCHKIAFVGALGYQDGIGDGMAHLTIPPYPSSTENVYDNCENWKWIRNWVVDGGKLVIMIDPTYGSWTNSWCFDQDTGKDLGCWLDCIDHPEDCLCDCDWPSSDEVVTDVVEEDFRRFAHFCATSEEEWQAGCDAHDEQGCIGVPIGDGLFNIVPETEFYYSEIVHYQDDNGNIQDDYMNLPEGVTFDNLDKHIPCCQQTIKPFVKDGEDSGGNSTGVVPLSFRTNEAAPLYPVNEGVGIVGSCGKSGQDPNPWSNACTVVYKQHGKGAVVVIYDYTVWGTYQMNSNVFPPRDDFVNGLTEEENKLMACNNDFWTFLCQDFLQEEGYSPSSCSEPIFWDNKGPDYEGNECLPKAACCKPDGTCVDLNVWECGAIPLSTYHGWQSKSDCTSSSCIGCDGDGEGTSCNTCVDIGGGCEEAKKGACCHCEKGSCPEFPEDSRGESCGGIDTGVCWPTNECSTYERCKNHNGGESWNWPQCYNNNCCELVCRGWYWEDPDGLTGPEGWMPHHTYQNMAIPPGIDPSEGAIEMARILCEDNGEWLYDDENIIIGITWDGGDAVAGNQTYGVLEMESCNYGTSPGGIFQGFGGFAHDHPWPGWQGTYESRRWDGQGGVLDNPFNPAVPAYTCGYWSSLDRTCKPPEEHPDWNPLIHGHSATVKWIDGEQVPCNGYYTDEDDNIVLQPPCGYPLDYANWGCDGCCTPYGNCCTGVWKAFEPLNDDGSSPPYEVGIGSTADGWFNKSGCGIRRQFDCDTFRGNLNWQDQGGDEYSYGEKWSVEIIDGVERHYHHYKAYNNGNPTLPGLTYDAVMFNEWHACAEGSPNCDDGASWLRYEKLDDIIRGEGATGSICYKCEQNSDCEVEGECCHKQVLGDGSWNSLGCRPCWPEHPHGSIDCQADSNTEGGSYFDRNPYGCPCYNNNDCCQCQSTDPGGVGITGANNYDPDCDCNCKCQASDTEGENYSATCRCEGETGENKPYCSMMVPDKPNVPGNWPIHSDLKCVECLLDSHCDEDQCCEYGDCKDPEEVECFSDDDCCFLAPCCSVYPTPCDEGESNPSGTCSVCQECDRNEDCFDHHCCNDGTCGTCIPCAPGSSGGCLPGRGWNEPCQENEQCAGDMCCRNNIVLPSEIHGRCWDCEGVNPYTQPCEPCGLTGTCCVKGLSGPTSTVPSWRCRDDDGEGLRWLECRNTTSWQPSTGEYTPSVYDHDYRWTSQIDRCEDVLIVDINGEPIEYNLCEMSNSDFSQIQYKPGRLDWDGDCLPCQSNCPYGFFCSQFGPTGSYASGLTEDPRVCRPYDDFCWGSTAEGMTTDSACSSCNSEVIPGNYDCVQCSGEWDFDDYDGVTGDCQLGCSSSGYVMIDETTSACCIRGFNHPHAGICEDLTYDACLAKGIIEENYGEPDIAWYGINTKCDDVTPEEGKLCPEGYCCDCDTPVHNHPVEPSLGWGSGGHGPIWPEYGCNNSSDWHYNSGPTGDPMNPWRFTNSGAGITGCGKFEDADDNGYKAPIPIECESFCCGVGGGIFGQKYDDNCNNTWPGSACDAFDVPECWCDDGTLMHGAVCGEVRYCGDYVSPEHLSDIAEWTCECDNAIIKNYQGEALVIREDTMNCFCPFNCLENRDNPCGNWGGGECQNAWANYSFTCTGACSTSLGACCHGSSGRSCSIMSQADCEELSIVEWEYYARVWPYEQDVNSWPSIPNYRSNQITYFYEGLWCDQIPEGSPCMDYAEKIKCHECNHDGDCIHTHSDTWGETETPSCRENEFGIRKCSSTIWCNQPELVIGFEWCASVGNICEEGEKCCYDLRECVSIEEDCDCGLSCQLSGQGCCGLNGKCGECDPDCSPYGKCCSNIIWEESREYTPYSNFCTRQQRLAGECCTQDREDENGYRDGCLENENMSPIKIFANVCTDCLGECYASGHHTGSVTHPNTTMYDEEYLFPNDINPDCEYIGCTADTNIYDCCWRCEHEDPLGDRKVRLANGSIPTIGWYFTPEPKCSSWTRHPECPCLAEYGCYDSCCQPPHEYGDQSCCMANVQDYPICQDWECSAWSVPTCEELCIDTEFLWYNPEDDQCQTCECLHIKAEHLGESLCPDTGACFDHTCYPKWYGDVSEGQCDGGGCGATGECSVAKYLTYEPFIVGEIAEEADVLWCAEMFGNICSTGGEGPYDDEKCCFNGECIPAGRSCAGFPTAEWIYSPDCESCQTIYDGLTGQYAWLDENLPNLNGSICGEIDPVPIMHCDDCGLLKDYDPCYSNRPRSEGGDGHWAGGTCLKPNGECGPCSNFCEGCGPCECDTDEECPEGMVCTDSGVCKTEDLSCVVSDDCDNNEMCCLNEKCVECDSLCETHEDCPEGMVCINGQCVEGILCETDEDCWEHGLCCSGYNEGYKVCEECDIECATNTDCPYGLCCSPDEATGAMECVDCECSCLGDEMYKHECCMQSNDITSGQICWKEDEDCSACTP